MATDDLTTRAHALLTEAMEIDNEDERRSFIDNACADDATLRAKMDSLLDAMSASTSFLDTPAIEQAGASDAAMPMQLGKYRILRALGVGGMATVYEAEQEEPKRTVALKVMRHALTHTSAVQRFRFETEILARLRHPSIAQIYEAGASDDRHGVSTPYFAMEFIPDALPITEFAKRGELSIRDRLALFLQVCDAVHHGHQVGVIHRDLKPGNVLVDGEGRPKVIDFGIARSTEREEGQITQHTSAGHVIGTLNYMSPEQHAGDAKALDIRTDVYALGVLLYELLCERLPHDLSGVSLAEAARIVRDQTPTRPAAINAQLRGDLEAVMLKPLDAERARRYQTVPDFMADVRRYLDHEPVIARPATTVYRLRKFAQRRRGLVAAIGAVALSIVLGVVATARQAYIATVARDREAEQRQVAEQREAELQQVVDFQEALLSDFDIRGMGVGLQDDLARRLGEDLAANPAGAALAEEDVAELLDRVNFLDVARTSIDEHLIERSRNAIDAQFADQPGLRARLLFTLAGTANNLGLYERAEEALTASLDIRRSEFGEEHEDTLECMHAYGALRMTQGRYEEAVEHLERAAAGRERVLGPEHPDTLNARTNVALALQRLGNRAEAIEILTSLLATHRRINGPYDPEALSVQMNLGLMHAVANENDAAYEYWSDALERYRTFADEDDEDVVRLVANLGRLLTAQGRFEEAEPYLRQSMETRRRLLGEDDPNTLVITGSYAVNQRTLGNLDAAETLLLGVLEGFRRVLGEAHPAIFSSQSSLGDVYMDTERYADAEAEYRGALEGRRGMLGEDDELTLQSMADLSSALLGQGRVDEAQPIIDDAVNRARGTLETGHFRTGYLLAVQASAFAASDRFEDAEAAGIEAYAIHLTVFGADYDRTLGVAQRLADLYTEWHTADPLSGHDEQAVHWASVAAGGITPAPPATEP